MYLFEKLLHINENMYPTFNLQFSLFYGPMTIVIRWSSGHFKILVRYAIALDSLNYHH